MAWLAPLLSKEGAGGGCCTEFAGQHTSLPGPSARGIGSSEQRVDERSYDGALRKYEQNAQQQEDE